MDDIVNSSFSSLDSRNEYSMDRQWRAISNFLGYHTNKEGEPISAPTVEEIIHSTPGLNYYTSMESEEAIIANIQKLNPAMTLNNIFMLATLVNHPAIKQESKEKYRDMLTRRIEEECRLMSIQK